MRRNIAAQIDRLKDVIGKIISSGTEYALLDFPDYSNVGDSAIWLGEIKLLSQLTGNMPSYVSTVEMFDADELLHAVPFGPILINGGGNFGDIWCNHQAFREAILEKFKDRLVMQMPQSIKFYKESAVTRCASVIAAHPNFKLLVRDQQSLEFAQRHFACPTELVPDVATALGALTRPIAPSHDIFMLLRTDSERASYDHSSLDLANAVSTDWLEEPAHFRKTSYRVARIKSLLKGDWSPQQKRLALYQQLATGRLNRGLRMLSSGQHVITDRLHAHILSTLLDIPHVALDNNYGKVSGYIKTWPNIYPGIQVATTAKEALEKLELLP
jgi:exopolysaccharide biosynthesis predicted pyruvyltransferase EpsI